MLDQRGHQAGHEHVARQHEEDVAGQAERESDDEESALGRADGVHREGDRDQPDHDRGLGRVLDAAGRLQDGGPIGHRDDPGCGEENQGHARHAGDSSRGVPGGSPRGR